MNRACKGKHYTDVFGKFDSGPNAPRSNAILTKFSKVRQKGVYFKEKTNLLAFG